MGAVDHDRWFARNLAQQLCLNTKRDLFGFSFDPDEIEVFFLLSVLERKPLEFSIKFSDLVRLP